MKIRLYSLAICPVLACACLSAFAAPPGAESVAPPSEFRRMLAYVYQESPRLASARQALKAEDEHVSEAVSGFRPTLNATGDIGRQREATDGQDWLYGTARDESLVLNQPLFSGFGTVEQFHAARARVSAGRAHLTVIEEQVLFDAIAAYMDVVTKKYTLQINRDNLLHLRSYADAAQRRLKAGDGTRTDLAQAQSRVGLAEANIATAEAAWRAACATYHRMTGLEAVSMAFPPLPQDLPAGVGDTIALASRAPEFAEAAEQDRATAHDIDAASSSLWPSLSLRGAMSDQLAPTLGLENLRDDSITLNVSIPLYQGGGDYARVREARELHEKAYDDLLDTTRLLTERATQSWYNYRAAGLVITASRQTAEAAYNALSGVEDEQRQGLRTMQETLDARAQFLNSLVSAVQAEAAMQVQAYRLLAATGQLTASHLHLDTPLYDPAKHYAKVENAWAGLH